MVSIDEVRGAAVNGVAWGVRAKAVREYAALLEAGVDPVAMPELVPEEVADPDVEMPALRSSAERFAALHVIGSAIAERFFDLNRLQLAELELRQETLMAQVQ